jgi:hypothetical protein
MPALKPVRSMARGIQGSVRPLQEPAPISRGRRPAEQQWESNSRDPRPDQIQTAGRCAGRRRRDDRLKPARTEQRRHGPAAAAGSFARSTLCRVSPSPSADNAIDGTAQHPHVARGVRRHNRNEPVRTSALVDRSFQFNAGRTGPSPSATTRPATRAGPAQSHPTDRGSHRRRTACASSARSCPHRNRSGR